VTVQGARASLAASANFPDDMDQLPILRHATDDAIVAVRAGRRITRAEFLRDVAALATILPDHRHILNLCADRYRVMVGFTAALCRGQISLLPPGDAPAVLAALAEDFSDLYALTDSPTCAAMPFASLSYPVSLVGPAIAEIPAPPAVQPALILFTSGSTGRPAPVPKSWGVLVHSARAAGARLLTDRLTGATVIGTVPHQHSYGLESVILLALQHGLIVDAGGAFYPADIRAAIGAATGAKILVTTPVHLRALVAEQDSMKPVNLILSATAPLPVTLAAEAQAAFQAELVEIYGCTEAGQVATRRTVYEETWHCLDGVTLEAREDGTWASGPAVEGEAFLQDALDLAGQGRFRLGGRSADLVDVAGKRTSLAYLNHHLLAIEGVQDGVFIMPEAVGQQVARLAALAVAPACRADHILQALRTKIDPAFLPRPLVLVDELPRNKLGKLPRDALLRLVNQSGPLS
jgi:acyl-coenzyme A synthetase/AMP-(fatty) acid ligase